MNTTSPLQDGELRASLLALTTECPADHCNPGDCPLFELRRMSPKQRLDWFNALGENDLKYLAAYHYVCLNLKLRSDRLDVGGSR